MSVEENLESFLFEWRLDTSSAAFRHFIEAWWTLTDKLYCTPQQRVQAGNWLSDKSTMDWLLLGYSKYSQEQWAEKFAECIDELQMKIDIGKIKHGRNT